MLRLFPFQIPCSLGKQKLQRVQLFAIQTLEDQETWPRSGRHIFPSHPKDYLRRPNADAATEKGAMEADGGDRVDGAKAQFVGFGRPPQCLFFTKP